MPRQQVRGGGRQRKAEEDQPVVGGHRARRPREQRARHVGDRLRVDAEAIGRRELLHHGERIVVAPDDLHAEQPLGRRAQNRRGDARVTSAASAATAALQRARPGNVDHRGDDQHRAGDRPAADVAHVRRQPGWLASSVQREQAGHLRERREPRGRRESASSRRRRMPRPTARGRGRPGTRAETRARPADRRAATAASAVIARV